MSLLQVVCAWFVMSSRSRGPRSGKSVPIQAQCLESRALLSGVPAEFVDPHAVAGNEFGASVTVLSNGNVVITAPNDDAGGGSTASDTGAGAVYLFNGQTGTLISKLTGSNEGDLADSTVTALTNGNFVVSSPIWKNGCGAVTFGNGTTGLTGSINSGNSLVGSAEYSSFAADLVGYGGVTALSNGNYVVKSDQWHNATGAVTWGDGTKGVTGEISDTNSFVGSIAGDRVGWPYTGVTALSNGNYVVVSPHWSNGAVLNVGAVTWANGKTGVHGTISAANSLIGSRPADYVGGSEYGTEGVTLLPNGNYVVRSWGWNGNTGAVTWGSGVTGVTGVVNAANSLLGSTTGDLVGYSGITVLRSGNYVVNSDTWHNDTGAVTWGNGATGVHGTIGSSNSLIGSKAGDSIGEGGITELTNGNYVIASQLWNGNRGAVTFGGGTQGVRGIVSSSNSLVGTVAGDYVGGSASSWDGGGITALTNGNYVIASPEWSNSTLLHVGAVTWCSGTVGAKGYVSASNSLVGSHSNDNVGDAGNKKSITALSNGHYVVASPSWSDGYGAVTWGNGTKGLVGGVSAGNSLVGSKDRDYVGSDGVTALPNGNYVVASPSWDDGTGDVTSAVTWGSGTKGVKGIVSASNSLVGEWTGGVGSGGITVLSNGNYVVVSDHWWSFTTAFVVGAVTWGNGTSGVVGHINGTNSLIGTSDLDQVGSGGVTALANGNYVVASPGWNNGTVRSVGAVTWGNGLTGTTGKVSDVNSLVGATEGDAVGGRGSDAIFAFRDGNYLVNSRDWTNGLLTSAGAATWARGTARVTGAVGTSNSIVGQSSSRSAFLETTVTDDGAHSRFYVSFPWDGSGHVYRGGTSTGFPSVSKNGPSIGVSHQSGEVTPEIGVLDLGITTLGTPVSQVITVTNNGNAALIVQPVAVTSGFSVLNNFTANQAIAVGSSATFTLRLNATTLGLPTGVVTIISNDATANSFTFQVTGKVTPFDSQFVDPHQQVGNQFGTSVTLLANGNVVITAPNDDTGGGSTPDGTGAGAVYLYNGQTGKLISKIYGSHPEDQIGATDTYFGGGIIALPNGNFLIDIPGWNNGRGAVTFGNGTTGVTGKVNSANSLVGNAEYDGVGGDVTILTNGNYVVTSRGWNAGRGAVTWGNGNVGVFGTISSANSLIGVGEFGSIGEGVTALSNGNYVVSSPSWSSATGYYEGAVTWGNGTKGITGTISAANSLVGRDYDSVGEGGITALTNGNYVINSTSWNSNEGAVTFGNGATGIIGTISSANSLVGGSEYAFLGMSFFLKSVTALSNGNYVISSPRWNDDRGAVTFGSGTTGVSGIVSAANSLTGSLRDFSVFGDSVGEGGITELSNGNYVVVSSSWSDSRGAVTFGSGTLGVTGIVNSSNSLVGTVAGDYVGGERYSFDGGGVTALANGNYVVASPDWNRGSLAKAGAVTWGSGTTGVTGNINSSNSLIGSNAGDSVGAGSLIGGNPADPVGANGITELNNGNYVVVSSSWSDSRGAVTLGSGTMGVVGAVNSTNSLVGTKADDNVGSGGVTALSNGNYVVTSPNWSNGTVAYSGAVTWGNGLNGVKGAISAANSLVGTASNNSVGSGGVTALTNGNYVVDSPYWGNGGAVTWGNGLIGLKGTISTTNSLFGTSEFNRVGFGGVTALTNGNYVVNSPYWSDDFSASNRGAVTWSSGTKGVTGTISAANSLVGTSDFDFVGGDGVVALSNGNYFVNSASWHGYRGAVTFGDGETGVSGELSDANSVVGQSSYILQNIAVDDFLKIARNDAEGSIYAAFPANGSGQVYRGSTATGFSTIATNDPSIEVESYSFGLTNGTGTVDLGTATIGLPVTQTITVRNAGNAPLIVQPVTVSSGFTVLSNFTANQSIAPASSASFTLRLNATAVGTLSGVVTITNNDPTASPFTFSVTGTVVAPKLVILQGSTPLANGSTVNLGSTLAGKPVTRVITVTNSGDAPLSLTSATVPSGFSIVGGINFTAGQTIAAGSSASFTLQLNASSAGTPNGVVTIWSNDTSASPFRFNVTGTVTAPKIVVQQGSATLIDGTSTVNLGSTFVGTPVVKVIRVTNSGNAALIVQPITVPFGFSVFNNFKANQSIDAGSSASVTLQLNAAAAGTPSGLVAFDTSDTTSGRFTFNVTGVVTPVVTAPLLVVQLGATTLPNGTALNFNSVSAGTVVSKVITVTNRGNAPLILQPVTVPAGFSVLNNFTANQSLAPGNNMSFTIQLNANAIGTPLGVVKLHTNDPAASSFAFSVVANHNPTGIVLNPDWVYINTTSAAVGGVLTTTDPDTTTVLQGFTYSVISPTFPNGSAAVSIFSIDDQGNLILAANAPKGVYANVPITSTDQGGLSVTQNFTIYVLGDSTGGVGSSAKVASGTQSGITIDSFPVPTIQVQDALGISENQIVAAASTSNSVEQIRTINVLRYQLGIGGDNDAFRIDANGRVQTAVDLNSEVKSNYHLRIISTNTLTGLSTIYPYTVTVVPILQQLIVVKPATFELLEGSANGTVAGNVAATVAEGQSLKYAITGGNFGGAFAIDSSTGQITVANSSVLNSITNPTFTLTVEAADNGLSGSATITIKLVRTILSNSTLAPNSSIGTVVGQFSTAQDGTGNTFTYTLVPGKDNDGAFTIDSSGQLKLNVELDPNSLNLFRIHVRSTDQNHLSTTRSFTIKVGPINASPLGLSGGITTPEDVAYQFKISDFGFHDPRDVRANSLLAVKITTIPAVGTLTDNGVLVTAGSFVLATHIDAGDLKWTPPPDVHSSTALTSFTFQVQDDGGIAYGGLDTDPVPKTMKLRVTSVNDAPTGRSKDVTTVEDKPYVFTVADFGFSDLKDIPPNALFRVTISTLPSIGTLMNNGASMAPDSFVTFQDINSGKLKWIPPLNINGTAASTSFTFQVQDAGGIANGGVDTDPVPRKMSLHVTPSSDAPVGTPNSVTTSINTPYSFTVGDFGFTDPNDQPPNTFIGVTIKTLPTAGTLLNGTTAVAAGQFIAISDIKNKKLVFKPAINGTGTVYAAFTFQVKDNGSTTNGGQNMDLTPTTMTIKVQ